MTKHFTGVLNVEATFDLPHIENLKQQEELIDLTCLPDLKELTSAIEMLKPNKAAGTNGILPEMVKCPGLNFKQALLDLVHDVWKGRVVKEWADCNHSYHS